MRRAFLVPLCLFLLLCWDSVEATNRVEHPTDGVQYETLVFRFSENLHFKNPFDLVTNHVELRIQQSDNSACIVSFFYDGLNKDTVEQWEARFAPKQAGLHRFTVSIDGNVREQFEISVKANNGRKQGGLLLSGRLGTFRYESGEAFRGIGMNVCWTDDFEHYFRKMRDAGMNITRIWLCPWSLPFEWTETGLGRYNLRSARRLDSILEMANKYGIFVILCIDYHGIAPKGLGFFKEDRWLDNPYNKANGGPCVGRADFFTSAEAKAFLKKKYKYIISRFGHSPNIAAWEFMNEADLMAGLSLPVSQWHIEMAEYVRSIDVHKRLISTSSTRHYIEKVIDAFRSPAFDFVMYHDYNSLDLGAYFTYLLEATTEYYQKPVVLGEFGVEFRGGDRTYSVDPKHIGLHNGIWSGWFNETPVIPMSWWWDSYIDKYDLWTEYLNLSRFADSIDISAPHLAFATLEAGTLNADPGNQAPCLVRCIYDGRNCALWFKNLDYQWSNQSEGRVSRGLAAFTQRVPGLVLGKYSISWYDPQTGKFSGERAAADAGTDGILSLFVPPFAEDLACLITLQR